MDDERGRTRAISAGDDEWLRGQLRAAAKDRCILGMVAFRQEYLAALAEAGHRDMDMLAVREALFRASP